jgi:serine/threonine-protein kinase RsbT
MAIALDESPDTAVVALELLEEVTRGDDPLLPPRVEEGVIPIASAADVVTARERGRALAERLGFSAFDQMVIVTAICELARNILEFATLGRIAMTTARTGARLAFVIEARDQGPGIPDPARVMDAGYSAGFGLPGVRRLMDELDISSEVGKGTTVTARKWHFDPGGGLVRGATIAMDRTGDTLCPTAP